MSRLEVPYFRPSIGDAEIQEAVAVLQSGWLTSGPRVKRFETEFAAAVGARFAVALNSATAALHLGVEALGLLAGQGVLVPTMTFAATAEVVRYMGAIPILVDCEPETLNIDYDDAARKLHAARAGRLLHLGRLDVVGVIPVHVGGLMVDLAATRRFAQEHGLWVVEDAAHAFPAAWREDASSPWIRCGENTSSVACYSFYANKTITTGEGGMAVTGDESAEARIRLMSLHGLSRDAWDRYSGGPWDYRIVAPGYKYNLTDLGAAVGIHQLARAEEMRVSREWLAQRYTELLADIEAVDLPPLPENRLHAWHLYPIRLRIEHLTIDRAQFIEALRDAGIGTSVHWRPLHLHPYYEQQFGWSAADCPVASREWLRLISLPIYPSMSDAEQDAVGEAITSVVAAHRR